MVTSIEMASTLTADQNLVGSIPTDNNYGRYLAIFFISHRMGWEQDGCVVNAHNLGSEGPRFDP